MYRKPENILLLLLLLAFTGQLWAAPFMSCVHDMGSPGQMQSPDGHGHHPATLSQDSQIMSHGGQHGAGGGHGEADCDCSLLCFHCSGVPGVLIAKSLNTSPDEYHGATFASPVYRPFSRLDTLFRPPISA